MVCVPSVHSVTMYLGAVCHVESGYVKFTFFQPCVFGLFCVTMPDLVILPCKEIACIDGLCGAHILFMQYIVCIFTETVEWSFGTGLRKKGHVFVC